MGGIKASMANGHLEHRIFKIEARAKNKTKKFDRLKL